MRKRQSVEELDAQYEAALKHEAELRRVYVLAERDLVQATAQRNNALVEFNEAERRSKRLKEQRDEAQNARRATTNGHA